MIHRVLIIGGYGNFGRFIAKTLALETNIRVIVAGRDLDKAKLYASELHAINTPEAVALDIDDGLIGAFKAIEPDIVIHTSGPFQAQSYKVAKACIIQGIHYIDIADGRSFVENIVSLDEEAKKKNILVISGASSVPCLTSALVDHYKNEFETLESLDYGITTAQKTAKGLATTAAILGYTGKPFKTIVNGRQATIYGWQGLRVRKYSKLGWKLLSYCDVPDLTLFPRRYPELKTVRFYAGLEIAFVHCSLWMCSWLVRFGLIHNLQRLAPLFLRISHLFDWFGSSNSAFHMVLFGKSKNGVEKSLKFELTANSGDGPYIPCIPAILMTKKLTQQKIKERGAFACMGFISLSEYLNALNSLDITWREI